MVAARMRRAGTLVWLIVVMGAIALAQLGLAPVIGAGESAGHATLHAVTALPLLGIAGLILVRWPDAGLTVRAPALGFTALASSQIVESFGAYGFEADNATRNGFAVVHDLGLALTPLGLLAAIIGVGLGLGALSMRRRGLARGAGLAATVGVVAALLLGVKVVIGL
jgi:hypothetical protein